MVECGHFIKEGFSAIRSDIPAFIYRSIVKSLWHWFNIEKIPNYTVPDTYISHDGRTIKVGNLTIIPSLMYAVYKLFYLPLFICSLYLLVTKKIAKVYVLFFVPYLVLWPIVLITFPDTRFKISAEIIALMPMMESLKYFINNWKSDRCIE